jgi:hypothetical protein
MKTTELFTINRTSKKLNETLEKTFGRKLKLETFNLAQLEDARNKLRTQIHDVRNLSGFNENLENDAFTEAQWMLDAINAEIMHRESIAESPFDMGPEEPEEMNDDPHADPDPSEYDREGGMAKGQLSTGAEAAEELKSILASNEDLPEWVQAKITLAVDYLDTARDYMKGQHEKGVEPTDNESIGENMSNLREGEIQQASAIVTAKTMVDRVGRWIEELSGMENDTLLTLGDSIRDEMGAEAAKTFISSCAPAIQQALQNLKDTREALSTSVRALTGEEQATDMLGGDEGGDDMSAPDSLDMGSEDDMSAPADDFAASEPGVGGMETAGREQRESIDRGNNLLRVLAG